MIRRRSWAFAAAAVLATFAGAAPALAQAPSGQPQTAQAQPAHAASVQPRASTANASAKALTADWTAGGLVDAGRAAASAMPRTAASAGISGSGIATIGGCTFYATSVGAGGFCSSGKSAIKSPTLEAYLHGRDFIACRYFEMPEGMDIHAPTKPGGRWMLKSCFQDVDRSQPWGGSNVKVEIYAQFVMDWEVIEIPGYMDVFWDVRADQNYYPVPRLVFGPTAVALVDNFTYFTTEWVERLDNTISAESDYREAYNTVSSGRVYLHAAISHVIIRPGVEGMPEVDCQDSDVPFDYQSEDAIPQSEGGGQESECWTSYGHSSAWSDNDSVMVHALAYWHVTIERENGAVMETLGDFNYRVDQRLAVAELQTPVDPRGD